MPVLIDRYQPWSGPGLVPVDQYGHLYKCFYIKFIYVPDSKVAELF